MLETTKLTFNIGRILVNFWEINLLYCLDKELLKLVKIILIRGINNNKFSIYGYPLQKVGLSSFPLGFGSLNHPLLNIKHTNNRI